MKNLKIPKEVLGCIKKLEEARFEAYLVGGCVRDILRKAVYGELVEPKDWDIATSAKPEEVLKLFKDSKYENKFGTVLVKTTDNRLQTITKNVEKNNEAVVRRPSPVDILEVTTYRIEGKYTDKRHPDEIKFAKTIEEDLSRRDFTINALALSIKSDKRQETRDMSHVSCSFSLTDPFGGQEDLKKKIIRTVGKPGERFNEDALRLIRAVRFMAELNFSIEKKTEEAIKKQAGLLEFVAQERIRDEFIKIIMTENAKKGIEKLEELGLLQHVLKELRAGIGVTQDHHHIYTVWEHNLRSLDYAAKKGYSLEIRLAALLHDLAKPHTKAGQSPNSTFYNHEIVGAKIAANALELLRFSKDVIEKVAHLVRYHMFYYNVGEVTEAGVRRFLARVGPENVDDFIKLREADRIGSGVPKAVPYKLRHLLFMIEKVKRDPVSPKMLKVNGEDVMKILKINPGPKVGWILAILLDEVLDDPKKNIKTKLVSAILELDSLGNKKLEELAKRAKEKKEEFELGMEKEIKGKYYIK